MGGAVTDTTGGVVSVVAALVLVACALPLPVLPAASVWLALMVTAPVGSALTFNPLTNQVPVPEQAVLALKLPMVTVTLPSPAVQVPDAV